MEPKRNHTLPAGSLHAGVPATAPPLAAEQQRPERRRSLPVRNDSRRVARRGELVPESGARVPTPVILDRAHQARVVSALEPEWEARFEPRSYGFRAGRGCHDAIEAIHWTGKGRSPKRQWVLDADLAAAFDSVSWELMLRAVARHTDQKWVVLYLEVG